MVNTDFCLYSPSPHDNPPHNDPPHDNPPHNDPPHDNPLFANRPLQEYLHPPRIATPSCIMFPPNVQH